MITSISSTSNYLDFSSSFPSVSNKIQKVWNSFKESIGGAIRNTFFLPLANKLSIENQNKLRKEVLFYQDFWNPEKPLNPELPYQEAIRKNFVQKKESRSIEANGKQLQIEYSIIESKNSLSLPAQNLVFILGNTSTLDNNIVTPYPFLASYLKKTEGLFFPAPLRIICISQYAILENGEFYRAKTLDESGLILTETLKSISLEKGPIAQIVAHSLGTIILASALKYLSNEKDLLPSHLYFDRGPSSIELASYKKLGNWAGWVTHKLAQFSGWDLNLGFEIQKHLKNRKNQTVILSEVPHDAHFGGVSLPSSPYLQDLKEDKGFYKIAFDFADQLQHLVSHHSKHNGFLNGYHLLPRNPEFLKNNESMSDKLMNPFSQSLYNPVTYLVDLLSQPFSLKFFYVMPLKKLYTYLRQIT